MPTRHSIALLLLVIGPPLLAQTPEVKQQGTAASPATYSFEAGLMQSSMSTDDEDLWGEIDSGLGFFGLATMEKGAGSVSLGVQRSSHGLEDTSDDLGALAFYLEPRWRFALSGMNNVSPYIGGRAGWTNFSGNVDGADLKTNGLMFGLGAGLGIRMTPAASLDVGVHWNSTGYGNVSYDGDEIEDTSGRASQVALRVGIAYHVGATP